ncbi:MAG: hypothetical protein RRY10_06040, partial [Christensenellaceae bacterium]
QEKDEMNEVRGSGSRRGRGATAQKANLKKYKINQKTGVLLYVVHLLLVIGGICKRFFNAFGSILFAQYNKICLRLLFKRVR